MRVGIFQKRQSIGRLRAISHHFSVGAVLSFERSHKSQPFFQFVQLVLVELHAVQFVA
jgi:hypothetical protein